MCKKIITGIVIISIVLSSLNLQITGITSTNRKNQLKETVISALVPHEPIEILNDNNFTDYGFPGLGTG